MIDRERQFFFCQPGKCQLVSTLEGLLEGIALWNSDCFKIGIDRGETSLVDDDLYNGGIRNLGY